LGFFGDFTIGGFNVSNLMGIKRRRIDIGKKILGVIIALFANFKCKCEKMYISKHFAESKKLFFCQYLLFSV
jgi:hypothetical protein